MEDGSEIAAHTPAPRRHRGPEGIGEEVATVLGKHAGAGESLSGVEEEALLKQWFTSHNHLFSEPEWQSLREVSNDTSEHEVRLRNRDHRAVKRTWPGTFGNIPRKRDGEWRPLPAVPSEYLLRLALQNELFGDEIRVEGAMIASGPSMIIGQPPDGLSLVTSQPWLEAVDKQNPYPTESEIAELLRERGFEPIHHSFFGWRHDAQSLIVLDAKPDNFIKTEVGILPIDLLVTQLFSDN